MREQTAKVLNGGVRVDQNDEWLFCLVALMLYLPVNNFSVISGRFPDFLGGTSTKHKMKCLTQAHKNVFSQASR